jgi:O-antigen/teichoic acid export membrane protein
MWLKIKNFLLENRTVRQTIAKNTFWLAVSNIGGRLLRAIIIIYAARVLGVEPWGVFSYAITLVAFLTIFVDFGINSILIKEAVRNSDPAHKAKIVSTSFYLKVFLLLIGVVIILFAAPRFASIKEANAIFPIVALILVFDTFRNFGFSVNQALERMEREAGLFLFTNLAIVASGFVLLALSRSVVYFAWAYAAGTFFGMMATFYVLRHDLRGMLRNFSRREVWRIFSASWPFAISGLLGSLMINTDILMIGWLSSASEVGLYSAAHRIIQLLYILPSILAISILPTFSRFALSDPAKMRRGLEHVLVFCFLVSLPIVVGGIIIAPEIISTVFGSSYAPATLSFILLLITILADFPAVILSNAVFAFGRQRSLMFYALLGGLMNVAFDLILIPKYGIAGSALATLIAQFASNFYLWALVRRLTGFSVLPRLLRGGFASVLMGGAVWGLQALGAPIFVSIPAGGLVYAAALLALREPFLKEALLVFDRTANLEERNTI